MADQSVHPSLKPAPEDVPFVLNGKEVVGKKGETIITVAAREGVYIPHYCWHPSLSVAGNCRLCLVEVHMPNPRADNKPTPLPKPAIACQTPVVPGMHVFTESELAKDCQSGMMEFLLVNHPLDCPICDRGGECMLQRYSMEYGTGHARMVDKKRKFKKPQADPLIDIERNRCIMCTRCVRFCDEVAGEHVMGVFARGADNYIGTFGQGPVSNILSGNVIDICPVGCLTSRPFRFKARVWELVQTQSTSVWDASGAKVTYWTRSNQLYRTTPPSRKYHETYTINEDTAEFIDNITRFGSDFPAHEDRWEESRVRIGEGLVPAAFREAVRQAARGLTRVREQHGPDALAVLVSPRATMEEGYLAAKFARTVIGTGNVDWRMSFQTAEASDAAALAFSHASGDLEDGFDAVVLVNGDYLHQAPVFAMQVKEYARLNEKPLILIGHHHDAYFAPHASWQLHCRPGETAHVLELLALAVRGNDNAKDQLSAITGAQAEELDKLLQLLGHAHRKGLLIQSLEDMNGANLPQDVPALLGLKSALGEAWDYIPVLRDRNAFGLYAAGAQPGRLPGAEGAVRKAWGLGESAALPVDSGVPARLLAEKIEAGEIKGLLCLGADILHNAPERERLVAALDKLEFFAVTDLFRSEITEKADVFFAAASHLERDGTYCDLEGNLARLVEALPPAGGSRPDWEVLAGIAKEMDGRGFDYSSVAQVFDEMIRLVAPDFAGSFKALMLKGPRNDLTIKDPGGARTRGPEYNPGDYRIDGAHFRWKADPLPAPEKASPAPERQELNEGEFLVTWGEHVQGSDYHLDRASIARLLKMAPTAEMNPEDAYRLGLEDGDRAVVHTGSDSIEVVVKVRRGPAPGVLYIPSGLGDARFAGLSAAPLARLEAVEAGKEAAPAG